MRTQITKLSFTDQSIYVGIDVHKKSWKVTIGTENHEHKSFSMNPSAHELSNYLSRNFPGGTYKAAELLSGAFSLVSEAVAPGWEMQDMIEVRQDELVKKFPQHKTIIERLANK